MQLRLKQERSLRQWSGRPANSRPRNRHRNRHRASGARELWRRRSVRDAELISVARALSEARNRLAHPKTSEGVVQSRIMSRQPDETSSRRGEGFLGEHEPVFPTLRGVRSRFQRHRSRRLGRHPSLRRSLSVFRRREGGQTPGSVVEISGELPVDHVGPAAWANLDDANHGTNLD